VFGPISMIIIIIWHGGETKMKRKWYLLMFVTFFSSSSTNESINKNREFYKFKCSSVWSASLLDSINVDKCRFILRIECVIDSFNKWMNSIVSGFLLVNITNQKHKRSKVWSTVKLFCLPQKKNERIYVNLNEERFH
jgi:hypothetical protein